MKYELKEIKKLRNKHTKGMQDLYDQFIEMGQLKSDFDIEKFTVRKEGNFIAHNFHFLMRQYVFALNEAVKMLITIEELNRKISEYKEMQKEGETTVVVRGDMGETSTRYIDLEILLKQNQLFMEEVTVQNKLHSCKTMEKARAKLIEMNGGKAPSNEDYQKEMPKYWKWFLERKALWQSKERITGIKAGVWEVVEQLEQPPVLKEEYQVSMLNDYGLIDLEQIAQSEERLKGLRGKLKGFNGVKKLDA